jgi:DNA-binding MarR family transcriptional regulator
MKNVGTKVDALRIVREISEKAAPGRPPAYSEAHVLRSLGLIGAGKGIGRQQLSKELRLGEGTVRTLVNRLRGRGLLYTSRGGMTLTPEGRKLLTAFEEIFFAAKFPDTQMTVGSSNFAVLVKGAGKKIRRGVEERDAAIIAGADGATTLVYDGERLQMPGVEMELDPSTVDHIHRSLRPTMGDVIIIGSADDPFEAEIGAISAALNLLERSQLQSPKRGDN